MRRSNRDIEVTVVCMTYNQEGYIERCLESLVSQKTTFRYEVIVHDDASIDSTAEIVRRFAAVHPSVVPVLQRENQLSQGKNIRKLIMPYVHGRFIALCEGDDWWCDNGKLQIQYDRLNGDSSISACAHAVKLFSEERQGFNGTLAPRADECEISVDEMVREIAPFGTNSLFFKTEYFIMPDEYMGWGVGDYPLCIWLAVNGRFLYLPKEMSAYRMHAKNSWSQRMAGDSDYAIRQNRRIIEGLRKFDDATYRKHSEAVQNAQLDFRISNAVICRDLRDLLTSDCRRRIAEYPLKRKVSTFAKCLAPRLFFLVDSYRPRS